jgi:general secretion pathway protein G
MSRRTNSVKGFTLIEVLLVVGILVVLATVGVVGYSKIKAGADRDTTAVLVKDTCHAVDLYYIKMGAFPTSEEGLKALCEAPSDETLVEKWNSGGGPFLKDGQIPKDPWGTELHYELVQTDSSSTTVGPAYHVWSDGPDRQPGTDDDIKNWTEQK